jgi:hypothetical protein
MPRLVGKRSHASWYVGLVCFAGVMIAGAVGLEYLGVIDEVPGFGQPQRWRGQSQQPTQGEPLHLTT